jgi:hypothetical protein
LHGPAASQDWYRDVLITGEGEGASDYFITPGEPWHVIVTGDHAYVAVPTTMSFTVHGKRVKQSLAAGWHLAAWAWAWAKGTQFDVTNQDNP